MCLLSGSFWGDASAASADSYDDDVVDVICCTQIN